MIFKLSTKKKVDFLNTKIETACSDDDLRPAMNGVYFKDGYLYATDAHIAIKQKLSLHGIDDDVAKHLDGQILHRQHLVLMKKCDFFECVPGGIKSKKGMVEMIHLFMVDERFPDVDAVIPKNGFVELVEIGLDADKLKRLQDVMVSLDGKAYSCILKFKGSNKAIQVTTNVSDCDQVGLLMPVQINR